MMTGLRDVLACPFCGGAVNLVDSWGGKENVCSHKVTCTQGPDCLGSFINLWHCTPEDAIAAWNTRANGPELLAVLGECLESVKVDIDCWEHIPANSEYARLTALIARIDALIGARGDG